MKGKLHIFFCYARKDRVFQEALKTQLIPLERLGLISIWSDADISPGTEWEEEIKKRLNVADIILLLISPDFIASEYCYCKEMVQAMERHERGEARVIPVILRSVNWHTAPFGKLQALPKDARPVARWSNRDDAFFGVAEGIRKVVEEMSSSLEQAPSASSVPSDEQISQTDYNAEGQSKPATFPIHLIWIIDCSSSMRNEKIQALNFVIRETIPHLQLAAKEHPRTQLLVRVITFATGAQWHMAQPTPIEHFKWTDVTAGGKRDMGEALFEVAEQLSVSMIGKHAAPPVLVLISDGYPSDSFEFGRRALMAQPWGKKAVRLAIGIGVDAEYELLQKFIEDSKVKPLQARNVEDLTKYIKWVEDTLEDGKNDLAPQENKSDTFLSHMLKAKQILQTESRVNCEIVKFIGAGGQAEVYRVELAGKPMALKWYFPHAATLQLRQNIAMLIRKGAQNERFLWPVELVTGASSAEFGYIVELRESRYYPLVDLMQHKIDPTFYILVTAGYQLADAYFQLHALGLCYRDISFGNIFLDPANGDILIWDADNVVVDGETGSGVLGTPHFMAPEIIRGEAFPSTKTDLFSLSVLLFFLFMMHHPLEGKKEVDLSILTVDAINKLYGSEPLFIFDPNDRSNRPVKGNQDNALIFWALYPQFLRNLFTKAFTDGLKDPNGRVRESEWRAAMVRLRDSIFYCLHCQAENFYDIEKLRKADGKPYHCWKCEQEVHLPFRLRIDGNIVMLNHNTQLFPHHIGGSRYDFSRPLAKATCDLPADSTVWDGTQQVRWLLTNLSDEDWLITSSTDSLEADKQKEVGRGQSFVLTAGVKINFGSQEGEIC